jgi:hypothetical protein
LVGTGARLVASGVTIHGNVQAEGAASNRGGLQISNNQIKGNLQCKENSPPPTGGGNRAASKEDPCERL